MGREVKRVPMDFDWPLHEVWVGYVNPHYVQCPCCDGTGETTAKQRLGDLVGLIMLSGEDSLRGRNHPYFDRMSGLHHSVIPSPDMAELTIGLAGRPPFFIGHDCIDRWSATRKIVEAAGLDYEKWGICVSCNGEGIAAEKQEAYKSWTKTEPPSGDGWQMWETVSEGSPMSPVFATADELAHWLADTGASAFAGDGASYEQWLRMIVGTGGSISAVMMEGKIISGVAAVSGVGGT